GERGVRAAVRAERLGRRPAGSGGTGGADSFRAGSRRSLQRGRAVGSGSAGATTGARKRAPHASRSSCGGACGVPARRRPGPAGRLRMASLAWGGTRLSRTEQSRRGGRVGARGRASYAGAPWLLLRRGGVALEESSADWFALHRLLGYPESVHAGAIELDCQLVANGVDLGDGGGYLDPRWDALEPEAADWRLLLQLSADPELALGWGESF